MLAELTPPPCQARQRIQQGQKQGACARPHEKEYSCYLFSWARLPRALPVGRGTEAAATARCWQLPELGGGAHECGEAARLYLPSP